MFAVGKQARIARHVEIMHSSWSEPGLSIVNDVEALKLVPLNEEDKTIPRHGVYSIHKGKLKSNS